ncbi:MAG: hypothetical protein KAQ83_02265 [Nanoarchaeota archaeon]|nr:hypothetical protein [Nanoarchaeota archaeon]
MFNPFKTSIFLSSLALLFSPIISCISNQEVIYERITSQTLEEVIKPTQEPPNKPYKVYESMLARETESSMETFFQYHELYPSIPDSGLILIVSNIPYEAQEGEPGLGKYAYDLDGFYQDTRNIAPQVQGTLIRYNFSKGQKYEEILTLPLMGAREGFGYRNNSHQTPAGVYRLKLLELGSPGQYWNRNSDMTSAIFEFHNILDEHNRPTYHETSGWNDPSEAGRGIKFHGPNESKVGEDGLGSGGCIRGYPSLVSKIGHLVNLLSRGEFDEEEFVQFPVYIYVNAPFDEYTERHQQIMRIKTQPPSEQ